MYEKERIRYFDAEILTLLQFVIEKRAENYLNCVYKKQSVHRAM